MLMRGPLHALSISVIVVSLIMHLLASPSHCASRIKIHARLSRTSSVSLLNSSGCTLYMRLFVTLTPCLTLSGTRRTKQLSLLLPRKSETRCTQTSRMLQRSRSSPLLRWPEWFCTIAHHWLRSSLTNLTLLLGTLSVMVVAFTLQIPSPSIPRWLW